MAAPLKKYWLPNIVLSFGLGAIICLVASIPKGFGPWYLYVVCPVGFAVVLGPLLVMASYWGNKRGARNRDKLLNNELFASLFAMGFERKDDAAIGFIEGYPVVISYEWVPNQAIHIKMVFDSAGMQFTLKELKKLYKQHSVPGLKSWAVAWGKCFMFYELRFSFKVPSHNKVLEPAQHMAKVLQKAGRMPGSFESYFKEYPIHHE